MPQSQQSAGKMAQLAGALAGAAALALLVMAQREQPSIVGEAKVSMLKYKSQPPEKDPFADFDKGFKAGPYRKVEPEENPMSTFDKGYKAPPYRSLEETANEKDPFVAPPPSNYPFDETAGGHVWKHWGDDEDSPMQALRERNVMDDGTTTDAAFQLGEHTLGRPFVAYKPDRNVFESLTSEDEEPHKWAPYKPERNVLDSLSPDTGYGAAEAGDEAER